MQEAPRDLPSIGLERPSADHHACRPDDQTKTLEDLHPLSYEHYVRTSEPVRAEGGAIPAPLRRRAVKRPARRPGGGRRASAPPELQADRA